MPLSRAAQLASRLQRGSARLGSTLKITERALTLLGRPRKEERRGGAGRAVERRPANRGGRQPTHGPALRLHTALLHRRCAAIKGCCWRPITAVDCLPLAAQGLLVVAFWWRDAVGRSGRSGRSGWEQCNAEAIEAPRGLEGLEIFVSGHV